MSKLQQALSQVNPPKVDIRQAVQGTQYRGAQQNAVQVRQENHTNSILGIARGAAELGGQYVDKRWKEADKIYSEAKAQGIDPATMLAERAKTESLSLGQSVMAKIFDNDGSDPLAYTRAITAQREMQTAQFEVAQELNNRIKAGDFTTEAELNEARKKMLDEEQAGIAKNIGVSTDNNFLVEGRTAEFEQTSRALSESLYRTADEAMRASRQRDYTKQRNLLIEQGVTDPEVFMKQIEQLELEGTINSTKEKYTYTMDLMSSMAATGRVDVINGLLNQVTTVNGQTGKIGDLLDPETRDGLILKAAEQRFNMDAELSDKFSRQLGEVSALAISNPAAALVKLDGVAEWYTQSSGTNQMTSQRRVMQNMRNQVLQMQARDNEEKKTRLAKAAAENAEYQRYQEIFNRSMLSDFVDTDFSVNDVKSEVGNRVINDTINGIQQQVEAGTISQADGLRQINSVLTRAPTNSQAGAGYRLGLQRQAESLDNAVIMHKSGMAQTNVPKPFENLMGLYQADPVGLTKVLGTDKVAEIAANKEMIDIFGAQAFMSLRAGTVPFTKEQTEKVNNVIEEELPYSNQTTRTAVTNIANMLAVRNNGDEKAAIKAAIDIYNKTHETVKVNDFGAVLPNRVLTPNRDPSLQPVVVAEVNTRLQEFTSNYPKGDFIVVEDNGNGIRFSNYSTNEFFDTNADQLLNDAMHRKAQTEQEQANKLSAEVEKRKVDQIRAKEEALKRGQQMAEAFRPKVKTKEERDAEAKAMAEALGGFRK